MDLTIRCNSVSIEKDRYGIKVELSDIEECDLNTPEVSSCIDTATVNLDDVLSEYSVSDILSRYSEDDLLDYLGEAVIIRESRKYKIANL